MHNSVLKRAYCIKCPISSLLLYWGFKYNLLVYIILYLDIFQKVIFALLSAVKLLNGGGGGKWWLAAVVVQSSPTDPTLPVVRREKVPGKSLLGLCKDLHR